MDENRNTKDTFKIAFLVGAVCLVDHKKGSSLSLPLSGFLIFILINDGCFNAIINDIGEILDEGGGVNMSGRSLVWMTRTF